MLLHTKKVEACFFSCILFSSSQKTIITHILRYYSNNKQK